MGDPSNTRRERLREAVVGFRDTGRDGRTAFRAAIREAYTGLSNLPEPDLLAIAGELRADADHLDERALYPEFLSRRFERAARTGNVTAFASLFAMVGGLGVGALPVVIIGGIVFGATAVVGRVSGGESAALADEAGLCNDAAEDLRDLARMVESGNV